MIDCRKVRGRRPGCRRRARVQRQRAATSNAVIARTTSKPRRRYHGGTTVTLMRARQPSQRSLAPARLRWCRWCQVASRGSISRSRPPGQVASRQEAHRREVADQVVAARRQHREGADERRRIVVGRPAAGARLLEQPGLLAAKRRRQPVMPEALALLALEVDAAHGHVFEVRPFDQVDELRVLAGIAVDGEAKAAQPQHAEGLARHLRAAGRAFGGDGTRRDRRDKAKRSFVAAC